MQNNRTVNQCLSAPGLAIVTGTSSLVKYGNTFLFKANSVLSGPITTANAPSLALATLVAPFPNGTAAVAGNLAFDQGSTESGKLSCRVYGLIATIPEGQTSPTITYSWLAGADFSRFRNLSTGDFPRPSQRNQCVIGWVYVVNATAAAFVPGTTALDTASLTVAYLDNYASTDL